MAYGRIDILDNGKSELNLFLLNSKHRKVTDTQEQKVLAQYVKEEVEHPVRIKVETRGPETELLIATPIEKCGRGRPRVLHDATLALKMLDICIFKVNYIFLLFSLLLSLSLSLSLFSLLTITFHSCDNPPPKSLVRNKIRTDLHSLGEVIKFHLKSLK